MYKSEYNNNGTVSFFFQCGLVLVMPEVFGEIDESDKLISKFVNENQVDGFLYVIKSNNAGGVNEDWVC